MTDPRYTKLPEDLDPKLLKTAKMLDDAADRISPDAAFASRLEHQLASAYARTESSTMLTLRKFAPALIAIAATIILIVVIEWMIRSLAPQRVPGSGGTPLPNVTLPANPTLTMPPTPAQSGRTYEWRGLSLSVAASLPDSPGEADIYLAQPEAHATLDEVGALAERFGIQGSVYETPGEIPDTTDFVVTDGRQMLRVRSAGYVEYTADIVKAYNNLAAAQSADADQIIDAFLASHGFEFPHRITWDELRGAYRVEPLAADGTPLRYESYSQPMLMVYLNPDGSVLRLMTSLLDVSTDAAGRVGIISAEEALQRLLDANRTAGILEAMHSAPATLHEWKRTFTVNETLTIYGYVRSMRPVEAGQSPFIQLDGYPLTGQTGGLDQLGDPTYLEAAGRFLEENGALSFSVETWQVSESQEDGLTGSLRRENDQVLLTKDDGEQLVLPDVPADLPMPFEHAFIVGTRTGDIFQWKSIDDRTFGGGGGGGGGGVGFYKLNLSGTPVPFPAPSPTPLAGQGGPQYVVQAGDTLSKIAADHGIEVEALQQANNLANPSLVGVGQVIVIPGMNPQGQKVGGLRGMLNVTINRQSDGSQRTSYGFIPLNGGSYVLLEGDGLEQLQSYNSRPVDVWGTMSVPPDGTIGSLQVERFEIPFPDLRVQVLQGKQKLVPLEGQPATLFITDDGTTYIQLLGDGTTGASLIGNEGDEVQLECISVPGETYAGYPALRLLGGMLAIDPKSGLHMTLPITRDQPTVLEMPDIGKQAPPETATIETVELEHFVSDPRYAVQQPGSRSLYLQPVWRFAGHYSNGDEFEVLIQAARDEFLLPELEPAVQPG